MTRTALATAIILLTAIPAGAQVIRTSPVNPGSKLLKDGDVVEVFVDESGKIYRELRYHGIIPRLRDTLDPSGKIKPVGKRPRIQWIGFQPKVFYSRVFVLVDRVSRFTLHKPDPLHIVATFENATVPRRNNRRHILTRQFASMVNGIHVTKRGKSTTVVISLRKPVGYLYKREGNYVFIDVER